MNTNHASGADAGGAGFRPETRAVSAIINRELALGQDFLAMNICDRRFGGGQEVPFTLGLRIQSFLNRVSLIHELGKLSNAHHAIPADDVGR